MNSSHSTGGRKYISLLQDFSIPLLAGVVVALFVANMNPERYDQIVHGTYSFFTGEEYHGHSAGHDDHGDHGADEHGADDHAADDHVDDANHGATMSAADSHESEAWWKHYASMHFLINDVFMVIFFYFYFIFTLRQNKGDHIPSHNQI